MCSQRLSLILFFCAVVGFHNLAFCEIADKIIAVVNDEAITASEIDEYLSSVYAQYSKTYKGEELEGKLEEAREQALLLLIEEKLILEEAKKAQIQVKNSEILKSVEDVKSRFTSEDEFLNALSAQNLTIEGLQEKYKERIMMQKLIDINVHSKINVTPQEVLEYYNSRELDYNVPESARLSIILIKYGAKRDKAEAHRFAKLLSRRLSRGDDFYRLAKKYSDGPNSGEGGGIGFVRRGAMLEELDKNAFLLTVGEISQPIETEQGYYIVKVEEKAEPKIVELTTATKEIENKLYREKFDAAYAEWIGKLKEKAYISIKK